MVAGARLLRVRRSQSSPLAPSRFRRHVFCEGCLQTWLPLKPECPECRAPVESTTLQHDRFADRLVSNVETRCQLAKSGCDWVGKRGELLPHLAQHCQCVSVTCPNEGCGAEMPRRELAEHARTCAPAALVPIPCPFGCGMRLGEAALERHKAECLMAPCKLMAAIAELARQNEQLTLENERLTRLASGGESCSEAECGADMRVRKAARRRAGPGLSVD